MGNNVDNITESNAFLSNVHKTSDIADFCTNTSTQNDIHNSGLFPMSTEAMFANPHMHNKMLSHYNCILIGCFQDIFQTVDTNNLSAVLQALKELNFVLADRAPELSTHYGIPLEPQQVSIEEVPDFISEYLNRLTANIHKCSSRGRPRTRGNEHYRHARQSSPVPRYDQPASRLDTYAHSCKDRSYHHPIYNNRDRCHLYSSPNHSCNPANNSYHNNNSNMPCSTNDMHSLNMSELIDSLQSQILGLLIHPLQQPMLNSIKIFDGTNKADFTAWVQSIENAARLCNLDALSIALSKLQGAPLKSANYLEAKETNSGRTLCWSTLKWHLTSNYSELPYNIQVINTYDMLQQGTDESMEAYLHRMQDILEYIHHTNDMSSISAIGTNHAKILTGSEMVSYTTN